MAGIVAAYQPHYYPKLHYLARAQQADVFVIYDDVQFSRSSPHHRAPIEYQGQSWLTIPVRDTGVDTAINDARIEMVNPWPTRHLKTLVGKYGEEARELQPFYERLCPTIVDPAFLRENPNEFDAEGVDDWLELDAEWRARNRELESLQSEKNQIGREIGERKQADPTASIDELVAAAEDVEDRLERVEDTCRELKARRDEALVELSATVDEDETVDELSTNQYWELEVDPEEWMGGVKLVELTIPLLRELFDRFEISSKVVRSSEIPVERTDEAPEYLARLTEYFDGDSYLSGGVGYENYMDDEPFEVRGLDVLVQDWTPTWENGNVCALNVLYGTDEPAKYVR
ncbi:hypothetical protein CV102_10560 [Natronococcus pandeyae]|uniref:Serine-tRNA synthetase type1 N-terminal domain-containing protein n=1 Tax=Natronococcus pandeyae TaxID=2055836 RepID=A0A8J8Q519_9EURY|nr:WbqC family protein [Natronococcus pandeyae]TYL38937.1 hypothetical protein CV102_10560 [Natronococcus pandeyae]